MSDLEIVWTKVDEAPALATFSLLPIVEAFVGTAGVRMKLKDIWCQGTQVEDLSVLKGMPLEEIFCDFKAERDTAILRSFTTLMKINDKPAQEFWKEVEAK